VRARLSAQEIAALDASLRALVTLGEN
jgi:hypothetical protein